jgi:hypothetical protein
MMFLFIPEEVSVGVVGALLLLLLLEEELDEDDNEGEGGDSAVVAVRIALVAFLLWVRGFTAR